MSKTFLLLVAIMILATAAFASVNVLSNGANIGPAQDINIIGGTVSGTSATKTFYVFVDSSLYTESAGTGGARYLCISQDGTIYGSASACVE